MRIGRFRLDDLVAGDETGGLWRAHDELLGRTVSVRLIPPSDPRQEALRVAACAAARVVDRHVVSVLDVLDHESTLVIVSEWVDGIPLDQLLSTRMEPARALEITREVASAIAAIHAAGGTHGRLRPASVMISSGGEVRVRTAGIDAQLWGIAPGNDPAAADLHAIGAILMACLTLRWPGQPKTRLRSAPIVGGRMTTPSQLRAEIPAEIDEFVIRSLAAVPNPVNVATAMPFRSINELRDALGAIKATESGEGSVTLEGLAKRRRSATIAKRVFGLAVGVAAIAVLVAFGSRLATSGPSPLAQPAVTPPAASPTKATAQPRAAKLASAKPSASPTPSLASPTEERLPTLPLPTEQVFAVTAASSLEQPEGLVPGGTTSLAIDGDLGTAWYTKTYPAPLFNKNDGAALLLDLGQPQPVRVIDLALVGAYSNVEIRTSADPGATIADYTRGAALDGVPSRVTIREPAPITARYVLVVLTGLPRAEGGYRGGISNITVKG